MSKWRSLPESGAPAKGQFMAIEINESKLIVPEEEPVHIHIEPSRGWSALRMKELWVYRELLYFLTWRDIKVRYKQTALGVAWAVIQPFMTMVVFSLFFGRLGKIPSDGMPYPVFNFVALLPWTFFSQALTTASNSLVINANMITKVYFPRLVVPISAVLSGLVDFAISFVILLGMLVFYRIAPTSSVVLLPVFLLLALVTALGVGLWLSALNVQYRDVRYLIPFLTQFWLFATPVAYGSNLLNSLGEPWRTLYGLNPMVGVVEGFRGAILGTQPPSGMLALSVVVAVVLLVSGLFYFRRREKSFADGI
jgi:lipopolysaccharide transport system permease protein